MLSDLPWICFFYILCLNILWLPVRGGINCLLYRKLDIPLTLNEGTGLAVVNTLANLLPVSGGLIAKGVYLKQKHSLAYSHYVPATIALYICVLGVNGLLGLFGLGFLYAFKNADIHLPIFLGFSGMLSCFLFLHIRINGRFIPDKLRKNMDQIQEGWGILGSDSLLVFKIVCLQVAGTLLVAGRLYVVFNALSQDVLFVHCVLFSAGSVLTRLVTLIPGGIGLREGIIAGISSIVGFQFVASIVAAGIDSFISIFITMAAGIYYIYFLGKRNSSQNVEKG